MINILLRLYFKFLLMCWRLVLFYCLSDCIGVGYFKIHHSPIEKCVMFTFACDIRQEYFYSENQGRIPDFATYHQFVQSQWAVYQSHLAIIAANIHGYLSWNRDIYLKSEVGTIPCRGWGQGPLALAPKSAIVLPH